jgi:Flp pilus assembly protein TadD
METKMRLLLQSVALASSAAALSGCGMFQASQPRQAQVTLHVADAAMQAGAPDMALRVAEIVLAREPHDVAAMVAKGQALYAMGAMDQARAAYRQAVAADPANAEAQIGLGRTLVRVDPKGAEAAFLAALARQPDNVLALNDLGIARDMMGRHPEAQAAYRQALAVSPDSTDVQTNLGLSLALSGDRTGAVQTLQPVANAPQATAMQRADLAVANGAVANGAVANGAVADGAAKPVAAEVAPLAMQTAPVAMVQREALAAEQVVVGPVMPVPVVEVARAKVPAPPVVVAKAAPAPVVVAQAVPAPVAVALAPVVDLATVKADASAVVPAASIPAVVERAIALPEIAEPVGPAVVGPAVVAPAVVAPVVISKPDALSPAKWPRGYYVQMGALDSAEGAMTAWGRLRTRWPDLLAGREPTVQQADVNQRTFWRLRTGTFADAGSANAFCLRLQAVGSGCWTVQPGRE